MQEWMGIGMQERCRMDKWGDLTLARVTVDNRIVTVTVTAGVRPRGVAAEARCAEWLVTESGRDAR